MSDKQQSPNKALTSSILFDDLNLVELTPEQYKILCKEQSRLMTLNNQRNYISEQDEIIEEFDLRNTVDVEEQYRILSEIQKKQESSESYRLSQDIDIEEQKKILEQIELNKRVGSGKQKDILEKFQIGYALEEINDETKREEISQTNTQHLDKIQASNSSEYKILQPCAAVLKTGHLVPLHGPEVTRQAIAEGHAVTVQCPQCGIWLQIKEDATLMFCPACSRLSPVILPDPKISLSQEKIHPISSEIGKVENVNAKKPDSSQKKGCIEKLFDKMFEFFGI